MNDTLAAWNTAAEPAALCAMLACCGARRWAAAMVASRPIADAVELTSAADREWGRMEEPDWLEAFACHPRIGERKSPQASVQSAVWSKQEQLLAASAAQPVQAAVAEGNVEYERRFGFTYIVCATGKTAEEMLEVLKGRLHSDRASELREAAEQQRQIMQIRMGKWLAQ